MWLISSIGFFSVVRDTHTDGHRYRTFHHLLEVRA